MSYILDALKKSDQQRQRGAAPTLQSVQSFSEPREPRRRWMYAALVFVLAAAAFSIGWLRPWETEAPAARAGSMAPQAMDSRPSEMIPTRSVVAQRPDEPLPQQRTGAATGAEAPTQQPVSPALHSETSTQAIASPPQRAEASSRIASTDEAALPAHAARQASHKRTMSIPAETAASSKPHKRADREAVATAKDDKTKEEKVVTLAELPASVRQELPQMTITVHSYSRTPKDRLLGVNDKLLHEGESLTPDLVLERITPDGMIFSYKGTRFQRGIQ